VRTTVATTVHCWYIETGRLFFDPYYFYGLIGTVEAEDRRISNNEEWICCLKYLIYWNKKIAEFYSQYRDSLEVDAEGSLSKSNSFEI